MNDELKLLYEIADSLKAKKFIKSSKKNAKKILG